ncbi:MAG: hypothetical protein ACRD12_17545 [Acidimicrobiales bacterium]
MIPWKARALGWTDDIEQDLGGGESMSVFVPSIMGVGILASLAILIVDALRVVNPRNRAGRRRLLVRRRAVRLVAPAAAAIGAPAPPPPSMRRRMRSRRTYAILFVVATATSLYVAIGSTANYLRPGGYLEGVLWMQLLASAGSALFLGIGVVALALAVRYPRGPRWARAIVDHTPLGVLER